MTGLLQRLPPGAASAPAVVSTVYPVVEKAGIEVQWQNAEGNWATIKLTAESPTANCQKLIALQLKQTVELSSGSTVVEVLDSYAAPNPGKATSFSGKFMFDASSGTLTTSVQSEVTEISADSPQAYLKRTLTITGGK